MKYFLDYMYNTHVNHYFFSDVVWNLFLAAVPCFLVFGLYRVMKAKKWRLFWFEWPLFVIIFLLWLFFLPNTVYLFTMVRHLLDYCRPSNLFRVCPDEAWEIQFFFTFALVGVPTFIYSLERMTRIIKGLFGRVIGIIFPLVIIPLTAIGLLIGLVRRFNSWDLLHFPAFTLRDTWYYLRQPSTLMNLLIYIAAFYLVYYLVLWAFGKILKK